MTQLKNLKKIAALCVLMAFSVNAAFAGGGLTGGATEFTQIANNA